MLICGPLRDFLENLGHDFWGWIWGICSRKAGVGKTLFPVRGYRDFEANLSPSACSHSVLKKILQLWEFLRHSLYLNLWKKVFVPLSSLPGCGMKKHYLVTSLVPNSLNEWVQQSTLAHSMDLPTHYTNDYQLQFRTGDSKDKKQSRNTTQNKNFGFSPKGLIYATDIKKCECENPTWSLRGMLVSQVWSFPK